MKIGEIQTIGRFLIPISPIEAISNSGETRTYEAMLDTGFSGWMSLPRTEIDELELPYGFSHVLELADGSDLRAGFYVGEFFFADRIFRVPVTALGETPLLGLSMLKEAQITMNVIENGDIRYQRIV